MFYYDVLVNCPRVRRGLLTYKSRRPLLVHQIVRVAVNDKDYFGLIVKKQTRVNLKTSLKEINQLPLGRLPTELITGVNRLASQDNLNHFDLARLLLGQVRPRPQKPLKPLLKPEIDQLQSIKLNAGQKRVYDSILQAGPGRPQLLFGVTGSGKSQVYLELARTSLKHNRSVLILVPEIGLSQQLFNQARNQLTEPVYHYHSRLTAASQSRIWWQALAGGQALVIVGPRSAGLLPLHKLGLIVIDECHDDSFKQSRRPGYQSLHLASQLARSHRAFLVAGSATPKVEDYYHFQKAGYPIHKLVSKALTSARPAGLQIVTRPAGPISFHPVSRDLIKKTLQQNHQVLIFHNRRGSYHYLGCPNCRWRARCPDCRTNLVGHLDRFRLYCHRCPHQRRLLSACPDCRSTLNYSQPGVKNLVDQVQSLIGDLKGPIPINRFDQDNQADLSLARRLDQIKDQSPQVIIGTQVISKGLNLTKLAGVILVDAETSLVSPDYRVTERSFQHICHLAGRVGRGFLDQSQIVIQSRQPQNPTLALAARGQWLKFYQQEINQRRQAQLPPFQAAAKIIIKRARAETAAAAATSLKQKLSRRFDRVRFYQPLPGRGDSQNRRWLINAFADSRPDLARLRPDVEAGRAQLDLEPLELFY